MSCKIVLNWTEVNLRLVRISFPFSLNDLSRYLKVKLGKLLNGIREQNFIRYVHGTLSSRVQGLLRVLKILYYSRVQYLRLSCNYLLELLGKIAHCTCYGGRVQGKQ